jgi:methionine-gamma-lyase
MSVDLSRKGIRTRAIHAGETHSSASHSSAPDLVMSALEQGEACIAFATGMAATTGVLLGNLSKGDHLVMCDTNYPGTAEVARHTLPRFGIDVTPVDTSEPQNVSDALRDSTRMIWLETPSNPLLKIADIATIAKIAREHGALLVVDSTFATPIATRPLQLGADLVVHSLTKYIGGHGDAMGGAVCGSRELLEPLRTDHFGGVISPFNAWLILRGMATLEHATNAMAVAEYLENHARVEAVIYPGLRSHPQHELAASQMDNFSGMLSFRVSNSKDVAAQMMSNFEIIHYAVSLGHHRSLMYLLRTDDLAETSYGLEGAELEKYRAVAGERACFDFPSDSRTRTTFALSWSVSCSADSCGTVIFRAICRYSLSHEQTGHPDRRRRHKRAGRR